MASQPSLEEIRHSAAHVMAEAVQQLFPEAKFGIGPAIENGFYYDFDLPRPLTPEDLEEIAALMQESIKAKQPFVREEVSRDEARQLFADQPYKLELIRDLPEGETISIYRHGDVHRPLPRPARGAHGRSALGRLRAAQHGRRLLARRREAPHAPAHLWHDLAQQGGAAAPTSTSWPRSSGATTAGWAASWTCSACTRRPGPGLVYWHPKGGAHPRDHRGFLAQAAL